MLFFLCCDILAFSQFSLVFDYIFLGGLISGLGISAMIFFMWMGSLLRDLEPFLIALFFAIHGLPLETCGTYSISFMAFFRGFLDLGGFLGAIF
jgi:hypothetical protein